MDKNVVRTTVLSTLVACTLPVATTLAATVPSRNLLTTEFRNNIPSVTLRGSQLSAVETSILPFENRGYFETIGGFSIVSVVPVVGTGYDAATCTVSSIGALCTDTAVGSNAAISIVPDPASNYVGDYRTFKVSYRARDPRANGYIYNPIRVFAVSIVFTDVNVGAPRNLVDQYVYWTPQP